MASRGASSEGCERSAENVHRAARPVERLSYGKTFNASFPLENRMRVEWTSYSSPIGALTVVECEAGPLVIEFPNRAVTIKWAVRLRAAVPELHIAQGSCRITTAWLDDYFMRVTPALPLSRLI